MRYRLSSIFLLMWLLAACQSSMPAALTSAPTASAPTVPVLIPTTTPINLTTQPLYETVSPTPPPSLASIPPLSFATPSATMWADSGLPADTWMATHFDWFPGYPAWGDVGAMHIDGSQLRQLTHDNHSDYPVISPDRKRIAYKVVKNYNASPFEESIWIASIDSGQLLQLTPYGYEIGFEAWSPDSQHVAVFENWNTLIDIDINTLAHQELASRANQPQPFRLTDRYVSIVNQPHYHPTGNGIAYLTRADTIEWRNSKGITSTVVPTTSLPLSTTLYDFDWMPDGQHIVYTSMEEHPPIKRFDPPDRKYTLWLTTVDHFNPIKLADGVYDVKVSPDGHFIAAMKPTGPGEDLGLDFCGLYQVFLQIAPDLHSTTMVVTVSPDSIHYIDAAAHNAYAIGNAEWIADGLAVGTLSTCTGNTPPPPRARFVYDLKHLRMIPLPN